MSPSRMWTLVPRRRWFSCWSVRATEAQRSSSSLTRPRCSRARPTSSCGWNSARLSSARDGDCSVAGPYARPRHNGLRRHSPGLVARERGRRVPLDGIRADCRAHARVEAAGDCKRKPGEKLNMTAPTGITRATLLKDLRLEWRSKDAINSMLFFSLLVVVVFSFSFDPTAEESRQIAGGLIWVAFLFAAVVALNQTWAREMRNQVLDAYRVSPAPANSLFTAKVLGNFIFVMVLEALMTPLFIAFYRLRSLGPAWQLVLVALLGTWALVVNGTFFAAMSLRTRSREIMLPLLLFPISIPAIQSMVEATRIILSGDGAARFWIVLLLTYDVVFTTACLALFETVLQAE